MQKLDIMVIKMFKELIDKLKIKKKQIQNCITDNNTIENNLIEQSSFDIFISKQNNIYKIEIRDYISIGDYVKKMKSSDKYHILDSLCNCVLWNSNKQKVNKGTYYVITIDNRIYNILFNGDKIIIDERTKIELDEPTQKENITQERVITININKNEFHYFSAKHDKTGNTLYTRYYNKNRLYSLGALELHEEETYDEVNSVIHNLESIEGIENILDIELLKTNILEYLDENLPQRKKCYKKL